ncbi:MULTISPECIES: hypothetical protein [unclassified Streptomyces]|uniref:hypothetical protein n=1 Tax=unclassified Streptomyces TaxID=2593676 RepID=UPI002DD90253|nr:hypothetical protein [Streptomyces sp. NBC_01795]WSA97750.1 hypothetical protein OIE63_40395 [Streptomyces sp. NBC_01795]WSS46733.1 hypothetical protein OG220_39825 [Streptomyces sp. NBC_01187]WSS47050.1 hypothetical protein OG220_41800 [Streptomyces sp. NBC_01187]
MNRTDPSPPGAGRSRAQVARLLAAALALGLLGIFLVTRPSSPPQREGGAEHRGSVAEPKRESGAARATSNPSPRPTARSRITGGSPSAAPEASEASAPADGGPGPLPVPREGPRGDAAIQRVLARSWPADLSPRAEKRAVRSAWREWRSDVTGQGGPQVHHRFSQVRMQAGIARRASGGRIQVQLVWAGTDPEGRRREGRTVRLLAQRHSLDHWKVSRE